MAKLLIGRIDRERKTKRKKYLKEQRQKKERLDGLDTREKKLKKMFFFVSHFLIACCCFFFSTHRKNFHHFYLDDCSTTKMPTKRCVGYGERGRVIECLPIWIFPTTLLRTHTKEIDTKLEIFFVTTTPICCVRL